MAHFIHEDTLQKVRAGFDKEPYKSDDKWVCNNDNLNRYNELCNTEIVLTDDEIKAQQIAQIDQQIGYEMTRGYEFSGGIMSTSPAAQMNWGNVINRYNAGMTIKMPFPVSLKDGSVYMIANVVDVIELFKNASEELENRHNVLLLQRASL